MDTPAVSHNVVSRRAMALSIGATITESDSVHPSALVTVRMYWVATGGDTLMELHEAQGTVPEEADHE
jgi:hypothetical protein